MLNSDLTFIHLALVLLAGLAQILGQLFVKLRQPKVMGERHAIGS
jgi:Kef-type K+ transport system membrane component KefB